MKSKDTYRAASNQDPALFQFHSALICKIQETSVFYFKYPEGTQCKFHFISAMLLCVLLSWWWAARGMWCYLRVIHLKYEL